MCHPAGSRGPGDLGRKALARGGQAGRPGGPLGFSAEEEGEGAVARGLPPDRERAAGVPGQPAARSWRVTCGRGGVRVSACADVSLPGPLRLPLTARTPRPLPPPPSAPQPHAPGHAERQTAAPGRPRAGPRGGAKPRGSPPLVERSTRGGASGEGGWARSRGQRRAPGCGTGYSLAAERVSGSRSTGPRRTARRGGERRPGLSWASAAGTAIWSLGSDHFSEEPLTSPGGKKRGVRLQEQERGRSQSPAESSPPLGDRGEEVGGGACLRLTQSCEILGRCSRPPPTRARSRVPCSSFSRWLRLAGKKSIPSAPGEWQS